MTGSSRTNLIKASRPDLPGFFRFSILSGGRASRPNYRQTGPAFPRPVEVVGVLTALLELAALAGFLEGTLEIADATRRRDAEALADRGAEPGRERRLLCVELAQLADSRLELV